MCVIAIKPHKIEPPTEEVLQACFENNKDGAGFMYKRPNEDIIHIEKGFMKFEHLKKRLDMLKFTPEDIVVYHFRVATSGAKDGTATHPFPVSRKVKQLRKLSVSTELAVAHNGIFSFNRHDTTLSDTQEFVKEYLAQEGIKKGLLAKDQNVVSSIDLFTGSSRVVILNKDGTYIKIGDWVEDKGILYSNSSFKNYNRTDCYRGDDDSGRWAKGKYWNYHTGKYEWDNPDASAWFYDSTKGYWWRHGGYGYKDYYCGKNNPNTFPPQRGELCYSEYSINKKLEEMGKVDLTKGNIIQPNQFKEDDDKVITISAKEVDDSVTEEDVLKAVLKEFLDEFFIYWHGEDSHFDSKKALEKAFEETDMADKLMVTPEYLEELAIEEENNTIEAKLNKEFNEEIERYGPRNGEETEEKKNEDKKDNIINAIAKFDNERQKNLIDKKKEK